MTANNREYLAFLFRCIGGVLIFMAVAGVVGNKFFPLSIASVIVGVIFLFGGRLLEQSGKQ
jgi:hypothetical protein